MKIDYKKLSSLQKTTMNVLYHINWDVQLWRSDHIALEIRWSRSGHFWKKFTAVHSTEKPSAKNFASALHTAQHGLYTSNLLCSYANIYLQINNNEHVHVHDCSCPSLLPGAKVWETNMEKIGGGCGGPCGRQQPCFGPRNSKRPPWCVPIQNDCTERNGEEANLWDFSKVHNVVNLLLLNCYTVQLGRSS